MSGTGDSRRARGRAPSARWALIKLLPVVSVPLTVANALSVVVGGLLPVASTIMVGVVVGSLGGTIAGGFGSPAGHRLVVALAVVAVLFVVELSMTPFRAALATSLGRRVELWLRTRVMRAALDPVGVAHLEDPELLDAFSLARGVGPGEFTPASAVMGLNGIASQYVQGIAFAVVLARYWWWLALAITVVNLVLGRYLRRDLLRLVEVMIGEARAMRRATYFRDLALTPGAAKETRIFGLRGWVLGRFEEHWIAGMREVWRERARSRMIIAVAVLVICGVHFGAFAVIGRAAVRGEISIGTLVVLASAVLGIGMMANVTNNHLMVEHGVGAIPAALALTERIAQRHPVVEGRAPAAGLPRQAITFERVGFHYPGASTEVYAGLDLVVPAGKSLAIVGANGAGKTTLVKLLARLYDPTSGRITVDGIDLCEVDPRAWQRRIAAIFQDFVQYHMPAAANVAFGAMEHLEDRDAVLEAARSAGACEIIDALPAGWDTVLSRQYTGGADLSGGQWQRLALARALFAVQAGAGVLVLDEPTANLDVRAEAELFDRFLDLTRGLTTILISHRFSTVRRADRIVVLDRGRVTEDGTHDELVARGGTYAEMFRLQASRFTDDVLEGA